MQVAQEIFEWHKGKCCKPWPPVENDRDGFNKYELFSMIGSAVKKELKRSCNDDLDSDDNRKHGRGRKGWRKGQDKIVQALTLYKTYDKCAYNSDCSEDSEELSKNSNFGKEM